MSGCSLDITFIDDFTRAAWILFLKEKSAAKDLIRSFVNLVERQFDTKIKHFFTDNRTEYVNSTVGQFFLEKGIIHDTIPAYTHEFNGMAERFNRTIVIMVSMILHGNLHHHQNNDNQGNRHNDNREEEKYQLSKRQWAEASRTAVYIKNRLPHSAPPGKITPFEALLSEKLEVTHIQPFGAKYLPCPYT